MPTGLKEIATMETTYKDILITYRESENDWHFELRGRERTAPSLIDARAIIDKPVSERTKAKGFDSIRAWKSEDYGTRYVPAIITGVAARTRYDYGVQVWVSIDGKRSKEELSNFVLDSIENNPKIIMINDISKNIDELRERASSLSGKLEKVEIQEEV